jgi:peptidoglycan/LPS O-acetylase OafA/YrhL
MGLCALGALIVLGEPLRNPILQLTAQMVCLAIVFQAAAVEGDSLRRVLLNRWLTRIGVASYSIFLVHLQILQILTPLITKLDVTRNVSLAPLVATCAVIGIPTVLAAALVFYWLIERPLVAAVNRHLRLPAPVSPGNP